MPNHSSDDDYGLEEDRYSKKYQPTAQYKNRKSRSRSRSYSNYRPNKQDVLHRSRSRSKSRERTSRKYDRNRRAERSSSLQRKQEYEISPNQIAANNIIGVFGLSVDTSEAKIREIFERYGEIKKISMVIDAKSKKSRGFCFIYFRNKEDATQAKKHCDGITIDHRKVRVDYSVTSRAHSPTPGYYLGKPTKSLQSSSYSRNGGGSRSFRGGSSHRGSTRFEPQARRGSGRDRSPHMRYRSPPPRPEKYGREREDRDRDREYVRKERPRTTERRHHERSGGRTRDYS